MHGETVKETVKFSSDVFLHIWSSHFTYNLISRNTLNSTVFELL